MGGFSIWHWLIVLLILVFVFGTKRLRGAGEDLGKAVQGFKKGMRDAQDDVQDAKVIESQEISKTEK